MIRIVYSSSTERSLSKEELEVILATARRHNAVHDITGLLLYRDGVFIQALEGEERKVRSLYATICQDGRHRRITTLVDEKITERDFSNWSMGFHVLTDEDLAGADSARAVTQRPAVSMAALSVNPPFATQILLRFSRKLGFMSASQSF